VANKFCIQICFFITWTEPATWCSYCTCSYPSETSPSTPDNQPRFLFLLAATWDLRLGTLFVLEFYTPKPHLKVHFFSSVYRLPHIEADFFRNLNIQLLEARFLTTWSRCLLGVWGWLSRLSSPISCRTEEKPPNQLSPAFGCKTRFDPVPSLSATITRDN
jgi:hypothetical protein